MRKLYLILIVAIVSINVSAQAPDKMSYQSVVRNSSNQLVTSRVVGMRISILQGSLSGAAVYVETQTPITNINGLVTIEIGGGTVVSGTFSTIDWSSKTYYIKTETDPSGGTNYTITGTSQLLSVPYALYSKTTGQFSETDPVFDSKFELTGAATNDILRFNGIKWVKFTPNLTPNLTVQLLSSTVSNWNTNSGVNAKITLSGNTIITMSNLTIGTSGNLTVTNTASSYLLTFAGYPNKISPSIYNATNQVVTSGGNKIDIFSWYYDGNNLFWNGTLDYK